MKRKLIFGWIWFAAAATAAPDGMRAAGALRP
jgi:hypothetical protein